MSATLLAQPSRTNQVSKALNRALWMSTLQRRSLNPPTMNLRRYAMNPNRYLSDQLYSIEGQLFKSRVQLEVRQSHSGVLHVSKDCADSVLKLLLGRILSIATPGSILLCSWIPAGDNLRLELKLHRNQKHESRHSSLPLLPESSPLRQQLDQAGISYHSSSCDGPWNLTFNSLSI